MRALTAFQTADGVLHLSQRDALRHADKRYGDALTAISHGAIRAEKYSAMMEFIDTHTAEFASLATLKQDRDSLTGDAP